MTTKFSFHRVFVLTGIISLALCYSLLWVRMITTPVERTGADFIAFYAAGRIVQNEGAAHAYDLALEQKYEEEVVGFAVDSQHISPYLHPPFLLPLTGAVALDDFVLSFVIWNLVMAAFLCAGFIPLSRLLRDEFSRSERLTLAAGILLFFPAYESLINGQDSAILYLGVCLWLVGILKHKDRLAGLGLALMTIRPHLAILFALPFLFKRRLVWWWFLLGASLLVLFSLVYAGPGGIEGFLRVLLVSGRGVNFHTGEDNMVNLVGMLWRIFPGASASVIHGIGWGVYCAAIAGLCVYWFRVRSVAEKQVSLMALTATLVAPHLHFHDLVLLIVPVVCLILLLKRGEFLSAQNIIILPLVISLALLFSFFSEFLLHKISYLVVLLLFLALWFPGKIFRRKVVQE